MRRYKASYVRALYALSLMNDEQKRRVNRGAARLCYTYFVEPPLRTRPPATLSTEAKTPAVSSSANCYVKGQRQK